MYDLQTFIHALTVNDGSLVRTATDLGMPLHALRSKVAEHAELQAIITNRDIEIADRSRDVVVDVLRDPLITDVVKLSTAKWALENLASDIYNKKQTIDVHAKPVEELTPAELQARNTAIREKLNAPKPVESFDTIELEFADPFDPASAQTKIVEDALGSDDAEH